MTNLVKVDTMDDLARLSGVLAKSTLFNTSKPEDIATKILLGQEIGLSKVAALQGIILIPGKQGGKVAFTSNLIASRINENPNFRYKVNEVSDTSCTITAYRKYESWEDLGSVTFTIEQAKIAGLTGKDVWRKYPADMLFSKCISRVARRYFPEIMGGNPVYTPADLEDDTVIESEVLSTKVDKPVVETIDVIQLPYKTKSEALEWGKEILQYNDEEIQMLYENTELDAEGKKANNFYHLVTAILTEEL